MTVTHLVTGERSTDSLTTHALTFKHCEEGEFSSSSHDTVSSMRHCLFPNIAFDSAGLCLQMDVRPSQTSSFSAIPCNTLLCCGTNHDCRMHVSVCLSACLLGISCARWGIFPLPADFLCCSNLLQKAKGIFSSTGKLEANKEIGKYI